MTPYNSHPYGCNALQNYYNTNFRMQPAATGMPTALSKSLSCIVILVTTNCWGLCDWDGILKEEFTKHPYVPNGYDGSRSEIALWEVLIVGKDTQQFPIVSKLYRNGWDTMALLKSCRLFQRMLAEHNNSSNAPSTYIFENHAVDIHLTVLQLVIFQTG